MRPGMPVINSVCNTLDLLRQYVCCSQVSSTHCQIGSIVAVGIVETGPSSVQWRVFYKILVAWGITVPLAAAVAAALLAALRPVLA